MKSKIFFTLCVIFAALCIFMLLQGSFLSGFSAVLFLVASISFFQLSRYYKKTNNYTLPSDSLKLSIELHKKYNEIIKTIDSANTIEEFDSLKSVVDKYNDIAEKFYVEHHIQPKYITFSDYDSKRDVLLKKTSEIDKCIEETENLLREVNFNLSAETNRRLLSKTVGEWGLSYQYTNRLCILKEQEQAIAETLKNHVFDDIEFVPEPDNPFDDGAVAIYHNNEKVGYIYKDDNAQHMVRDWVRMERYFCGYISKYDSENEEIYYDIGFYKKK